MKTYKQTNCESCLPVCLLLLAGKKITKRKEDSLLLNGINNFRESYALGVTDEFVDKYKIDVNVFIDNKTYSDFLKNRIKSKRIRIFHKRINSELLKKINGHYILQIDHQILGVYSHCPHYIIVKIKDKSRFEVFDPWTGKITCVKKEKLISAINSLRSYLRYCPVLISLTEER
jgi:hypothetical protein